MTLQNCRLHRPLDAMGFFQIPLPQKHHSNYGSSINTHKMGDIKLNKLRSVNIADQGEPVYNYWKYLISRSNKRKRFSKRIRSISFQPKHLATGFLLFMFLTSCSSKAVVVNTSNNLVWNSKDGLIYKQELDSCVQMYDQVKFNPIEDPITRDPCTEEINMEKTIRK